MAVFAFQRFVHQQLVDVGAHTGAHQTRIAHLRAAQRDHPIGTKPAGHKQLADGDNIW